MLQDTEGTRLIPCGWKDRYSIRPHPPEAFLHDCLSWDPFFYSLMFYRREGTSHFAGSCRVPDRILCQIQILYILEIGSDFVPYGLEAFLARDT